jgi:glycosyltransferase involved in cell wall biosynthesis
MAIAGIWAGKRSKIPVIFDMAEDYVSLVFNTWRFRKLHVLNFFVRNPYVVKIVERYSFKNVDHIFVVIDEANKVVQKGGGNIENITIVSNTPSLKEFDNCEIKTNGKIELIIKERFSAIYTGGIQLMRGLQIVFDAIPDIVKVIPDFLFVIIGDGYAAEQLKRTADEKNVQEHVLWVGRVAHEKMFNFIKLAKIGLIPHFVTNHTNTTIPNKIYDYMACGLPIVSSDTIPMKRILDEEKCGITFKNGDAKDLAKAILEIRNSDFDYGKKGIHAVKNKYNWQEDERRLIKVIEKYNNSRDVFSS